VTSGDLEIFENSISTPERFVFNFHYRVQIWRFFKTPLQMEERFVYNFWCGVDIWRFLETPLQRQNDLFLLSAVKCKFGDFSKLLFHARMMCF
jgi:hypothetical protein